MFRRGVGPRGGEAGEGARARTAVSVPPHAFFLVSAVFHYLGPAFAVLLFRYIAVLGVAWLRIVSASMIFAPLAAALAGVALVVSGVALHRTLEG